MKETMTISEIWETSITLDTEFDVSYRLFRINVPNEIYLLCINLGDESTAIIAGYDEKEARSFAELWVKEEVTPCTANNIYADMINK